jgi:nucleoside-diphosphate-sugar epimerase
MQILITGGSGFVGRHFVKKLDNGSNEITVVDNLITGGGGLPTQEWIFPPSKNVNFIFEDCRKYFSQVRATFDLVIHLAAVVGGRLTIERNPLAVAEDLSIDADFWKWAVSSSPGRIITFSSSSAYPVSLQETASSKLKESDINFSSTLGMPDLTYGWAKLTNEYLGLLASEKYGLKVATYRPFSGYGEDQSLDYPFPSICKRAVEQHGSEFFEVWGSGLQSRDFVHIDDIVDGVMETYMKIEDGSALNLCSGILTTFIDLAKLACSSVGYNPKVSGNVNLPEGVFSRVGDPTRMESFGWCPTISLRDGVQSGVDYWKFKLNMR